MNAEKDGRKKIVNRYRPKKLAILGMGLLFFAILGLVAMTLCNFRVQYAEQAILTQQGEAQRAWLDKTLDAIRVWRNELVEQARHISASEMFRLFAVDAKHFSAEDLAKLAEPESLHSPDETVRAMAEQMTYIQDLLSDFTRRRAWDDARILLPDGTQLAAPSFSFQLGEEQTRLAREAAETGQAVFGPIRKSEKGLVMDMADPLFEVLGGDDSRPVAALLLSVPVEKPLATFLARNGEQAETLLPRIVNQENDRMVMAIPRHGGIALERVENSLQKLENIHFGRRAALDGKSEVYSIGGMPTILKWLLVVEAPARDIDELIHSQKIQIYGLGILASIGIALLAALIWAGLSSRAHEARARHLEKLYTTIRNQKMMLDSVNASLQAGLVLVDAAGRIQMCNRAFQEMRGNAGNIPPNTPLAKALPGKAAVQLLQDMALVNDLGQSASMEVSIAKSDAAGKEENRLYRVTLFPYSDSGNADDRAAGCVAIFQDITEFRRNAENARKRQEALISALGRAIESVDPHLVGHSDKMAKISDMLARQLNFDCHERETLLLAARLSQVGKIFVPRELLTKQGKLAPEELREVRRAPEYADKILHDLYFDLPVRETVRMMSERIDGSGKPDGLSGTEISMAGRALAIVNAFIAMTSARAWRADGGMAIHDAISQLKKDAGLDQDIVSALAQLSSEEMAMVIGGKKNGEDSQKTE